PWFDQLARFSFGVPSNLRSLEPQGDKPSFLRVHTPQTLIIADEAPLLAFLKVKGQFPLLSTPTGGPSNTPAPPAGAIGGTPMPPPGGNPPVPAPPMPLPVPPMPLPKPPGGAGIASPRPEFTAF